MDQLHTSILSFGDKQALRSAGLLGSVSSDGMQLLHKRRLNKYSEEDNAHIPLISIREPMLKDEFIRIPQYLASEVTLRYLGFKPDVAALHWQQWLNFHHNHALGPLPFIDFCTDHIKCCSTATKDNSDDEEWYRCMDSMGLDDNLQTAIMDPVFESIRLTKSCQFWVEDTLRLWYNSLEEIQTASSRRAMAGYQNGALAASATAGLALDLPAGQAGAARYTLGNTLLCKSIRRSQVDGIFDQNGRVLDLVALLSKTSNDFLSAPGFSFALDKEIALLAAHYAKHRDNASSTALVQIAVPNSIIEALSETECLQVHWPDPEWISLTYHCRRLKRKPPELRKFGRAKLIIGTISSQHGHVESHKDTPGEATESQILKCRDGRPAVQYVWSWNSLYDEHDGGSVLEEHGRLMAFPIVTQEYEEWYKGLASMTQVYIYN